MVIAFSLFLLADQRKGNNHMDTEGDNDTNRNRPNVEVILFVI